MAAKGGGEWDGKLIPDFVARNLVEAVRLIAQQRKPDLAEEAKAAAARRIDVRGARSEPADTVQVEQSPPQPRKPQTSAPVVSTTTQESPKADAPEADAPKAEAPGQTESPDASSADEAQSEPTTQTTAKDNAASPPAEEQDPASASASTSRDQMLQELVAELRSQGEKDGKGISTTNLLAGFLQLAAVGCLAAGYFLSEDQTTLVRWLFAGVAVEMIVVSLLLLRR